MGIGTSCGGWGAIDALRYPDGRRVCGDRHQLWWLAADGARGRGDFGAAGRRPQKIGACGAKKGRPGPADAPKTRRLRRQEEEEGVVSA